MIGNHRIITGFMLNYRIHCRRNCMLYRLINGFCNVVESPDLPVWVKSPKKKSPPMKHEHLFKEKEEEVKEEEEDFVLPTKLDALGEWPGSGSVHSGSKFDRIAPIKVLAAEANVDAAEANVDAAAAVSIGKILNSRFTSPEDVVRALCDGCNAVNVSNDLVDKMLKRYNNDWVTAFGFFNWVDSSSPSKIGGYKHSSDSYNTMVDILGKARQFRLMWALIEEMVQVGQLVSLKTMSRVMRRLAGAGKWTDAIQAFGRIESFGVKKDTSAMNVLLDTLCKENSVKRAWDVFLELRDKIPPDASSFNALIHGWCKAHKLEEARWMMEEMTRYQINPCVISYTCFIEAYCKVKNFRQVDSIMEEMQSRGCPPNTITYTIVMHSLGKAKETQEAFLVYDKMKRNGCIPDTSFYNSLIYILGRAGRLQDAYDVFAEMSKNGIDPNLTTYNTMITAACDHSQEENALKLLNKMEENSCKPDIRTFSPLLKMGCKKKAMRLLYYLLDYMANKDISLDLGTYTLLVHELCRNGKLEKACFFFEEMVSKGFLPRNNTYCMLIEALETKNMDKVKEKIQQTMARAHRCTRCEVVPLETPVGINT